MTHVKYARIFAYNNNRNKAAYQIYFLLKTKFFLILTLPYSRTYTENHAAKRTTEADYRYESHNHISLLNTGGFDVLTFPEEITDSFHQGIGGRISLSKTVKMQIMEITPERCFLI